VPDLVLDYHRLRAPIDHPDLSVTRAKLEYPTVNVSFAYLAAIGKVVEVNFRAADLGPMTVDSFADKAVELLIGTPNYGNLAGRWSNTSNYYFCAYNLGATAADFYLAKVVAGTQTTLATEAVDLSTGNYLTKLSCSGSTLKAFRVDMTTPKLTATDTSLASGMFGGSRAAPGYSFFGGVLSGALRAPASASQPALLILEVEVGGSGAPEDPFRPSLSKSLAEISTLTGLPDFLYAEAKRYEILRGKGFADEEMQVVFGYVPQHQVDLDAVTWGAFEPSEKSPTNIIVVTEDNPYKQGAIQRQAERAKKKGLRVFGSPKNYGEAVALYNKLKSDFPHWLAGKDNFAYMCLGWEELDVLQNVDFYYGELVEHRTHHNQLRQVPEWEIRDRLLELKARLEQMAALHEERDKHLRKVEELLKRGW
jgi:hypothetical protein